MKRLLALLAIVLTPVAASAAEVAFDGPFVQGGLVFARAPAGASVVFDGRSVRVAPDGGFLIGFGRDAGPEATLDLVFPDGRRETMRLAVARREWAIQRIDGLPERQVTPSPEDLQRIKDDVAQVAAVRARDTTETLFRSGFVWPVVGPISGVYGSQRILNGQPRTPHVGVDIAAPPGAPVVAAADGIVSLAHPDMFFTGKTVVIDHGYGLNTAYSHLSEITVAAGARVRQGETIGRVGATGRATGPHLDWRVNLFDIRLDPALLVPPMPVSPASGGEPTATDPAAGGPSPRSGR
ncbi:MAG: M23 family metallopeptidase [Rhodospirillales bacterium]|nr:M23 family metallopeptidase [Rhodospirillales bacterium]